MFADRRQAGRRLARELERFAGESPIVVGLPRGGVPVAAEVADELGAPLDVILVRKVGVPFQHELAMGAIGEDGVTVLNDEVIRIARIGREEFERVAERERAELDRRAARFRGGRPAVRLEGRTVIVVDDGIATGSTARAACQVARAHGAARVVLATPVAPLDWTERLADAADEYVCVDAEAYFGAVGAFYEDFRQITDDEVVELLRRHSATSPDPPEDPDGRLPRSSDADADVEIDIGPVRLLGHLTVPPRAVGVVLFAHGSGSSRHSPRNRSVAAALQQAGIATVLFDLLTEREEIDRANVFDIELLAGRVVGALDWARTRPELAGLPVGLFGASTGAAAALRAAVDRPVRAVVSRGGRPDLAQPWLGAVTTPTLLIVGDRDYVVLDLNREAAAQLRCENQLATVPGATHLFTEPGTLAAAAALARDWFLSHFGDDQSNPRSSLSTVAP